MSDKAKYILKNSKLNKTLSDLDGNPTLFDCREEVDDALAIFNTDTPEDEKYEVYFYSP